jgi:hypothetical protein
LRRLADRNRAVARIVDYITWALLCFGSAAQDCQLICHVPNPDIPVLWLLPNRWATSAPAERNPPLRGATLSHLLSGADSRRGSRPQTWLAPSVPVVLIRLRWQALAVGGMLFGAAAWQLNRLGHPEAKLFDALIIGQTSRRQPDVRNARADTLRTTRQHASLRPKNRRSACFNPRSPPRGTQCH